MDNPPKHLTAEQIANLTEEEFSQILEFYTEEEKESILEPLKDSIALMNETIQRNKTTIENGKIMNELFLKRIWKTLKKEEKIEGAEFFKSLHDDFTH